MNKFEETLNTLAQLEFKLRRGHWTDIKILEEEDFRYSIALKEAVELISRLEDLMR